MSFPIRTIADSWETLHAKLTYEKHLQDLQGGENKLDSSLDISFTNNNENNKKNNPQDYNYSSSHEGTVTGDEMSISDKQNPIVAEIVYSFLLFLKKK
jgi:hypothetical protein